MIRQSYKQENGMEMKGEIGMYCEIKTIKQLFV